MDSVTRGGCTAAAPATLAETLEFTPSASASFFAFGVGIEGKLREPAASLPASALTSEATFATDLASSPLCGIAPSRTMVANSIGSPQWLREQLGPHSQPSEYTALRYSWHWPIGHIRISTSLWPLRLPFFKLPY